MTVKDRVIFVPRGPRGIKGDQGVAGDGAASLTPRIDEIENVRGKKQIYWNAVSGNDSNPGSAAYPVQTAQRVCELLQANVNNLVYLQSDVVWDYYLDATNDLKIQISGYPSSYYSVTFTDSINNASFKGGIRTDSYGTLIFLYTKIYLDGQRDDAVFKAIIGKWKVRTFATDFERLGGADGVVFSNTNGGEIVAYFQGANMIDMQGHLFDGVGAGLNPNDRDLVYANLTSA